MSRGVRYSLLVSWIAVSVVLFVAGHWQLRALHTAVQSHNSAVLLHKDRWSNGSANTLAAASSLTATAAAVVLHTSNPSTAGAGLGASLGSRSYHRTSDGSVQLVLHTDTTTDSSSNQADVGGQGGDAGASGDELVRQPPQHSKIGASSKTAGSSSSSSYSSVASDSADASSAGVGAGSSIDAGSAAVSSSSVGDAGTSTDATKSKQAADISSSSSSSSSSTTQQRQGAGAGSSSSSSNPAAGGTSSTTNTTSSSSQTAPAPQLAEEGATPTPSSSSTNSSSSSSSGPAAYSKDLLLPVLALSARAKSDPAYLQKLKDAASKPINIAVMTGLFWQLPKDHTKGCEVDGVPLDCHIQNGGNEEFLNKADALYYHVPSFAGRPRAKAFPTQLRLAMSLESSSYYANLDNPSFMCHFDAEMTYRTCGQVTNWYSLESLHKLFETQLVPFEEKLHAIAYVNSNCGAQSGRSDILRSLMKLGDKLKVPVHALGACDRNKPWPPGNPNKIEVMRRYKFCVAMENSVRQDYMTEKMWDALAAGCIPIYMGSSNARHIVPEPNSFIVYDPKGKKGHASTPEQLDAVMHGIGNDKARYEAMVAWKHRKPEEQPNEIFRYLWSVRKTTGECFLCQFLARHRAEPQPAYDTCLFNKDWMASAGQHYTPKEQACPKDKTQKPAML